MLCQFCSNFLFFVLLHSISGKLCPRSPWRASAVFVSFLKKILYIGKSWWKAKISNTVKFLSGIIASCTARTTYRERKKERKKERNRRGGGMCFTPARRSDVGFSSVASPFSDWAAHYKSGLNTPIIHGLLRIDNEPKRKSAATFKCRLAVRNLIAVCSLVQPAELSPYSY